MQLMLSKCSTIVLFIGISWSWMLHDYILTSALKIGPDNEVFKACEEPTLVIMDIYFYNWTNPKDIYNSSIKPNFVEVGPYRFRQLKQKTNVTWNNENQTVTYQYLKNFYLDENSPRHDSDVITSINMVALSVAHKARDWNILLKQSIKFVLSSSEIYVQKTVRELLFEGYEDPILEIVKAIPGKLEDKVDRFGWFNGRNGSVGADGVYNMGSSRDDNFGTLKRWNYADKTPFYEGHCADISGSAGELYPENVKPTLIKFFSPIMCRTVQFNFESNVTVKGILSYKYSPGDEVFDNGTEIKENACFCNGRCMPSGILNVSSCRQDAPLYLSLPHFYYADKSYVDAVEGLLPVKEKHEMYLTLEPNTGIIADKATRIQVNALLQPLPDFPLFENVPEIMFPVFWFEEKQFP